MKKLVIFTAAALIVTAYLVWFILYYPMYIIDCVFAYIVIIVFFLLEKQFPLKPWLIVLGLIPSLLELTALNFGFFGFSIYGFGFDKMFHITNSFILTTLMYFWISTVYTQHKGIKIIIAVLIVMGIGSLGEIMEFVGQVYFHMNNAGAFSQGDLLPPTLKNDFTIYDTWWDMISNLIGASLAGMMMAFRKK